MRAWLIRELAPRPGDTVLELAAGAGDTGFEAAAIVGEHGRLISTDFSPGAHHALPLPEHSHPDQLASHGMSITRDTTRDLWSARCLERGTPGAGSGPKKRLDRKTRPRFGPTSPSTAIRTGQHRPGPVRSAQPRPGLAAPPRADRTTGTRVGHPAHHAHHPARAAPRDEPAPPPRPPPPADRPGHRTPPRPHPRRPAPGCHPAHRLGRPQVAIAGLFTVRPETINKQLRTVRKLLQQAGHTIQPDPNKITTIDDLHNYAAANGITTPPNIKTAS
jgi:hypothetical protein